MRIGGLAATTGLTMKTIRFCEGEGLLPVPGRTTSGYRFYGETDTKRLGFVLKAKRLGLSLEEIKSILQLHDRREPTCVHVRSLLDEKLSQVEKAIAELREFRAELSTLRDQAGSLVDCRPLGGDICGIIEGSAPAGGEVPLGWPDERWAGTAGIRGAGKNS